MERLVERLSGEYRITVYESEEGGWVAVEAEGDEVSVTLCVGVGQGAEAVERAGSLAERVAEGFPVCESDPLLSLLVSSMGRGWGALTLTSTVNGGIAYAAAASGPAVAEMAELSESEIAAVVASLLSSIAQAAAEAVTSEKLREALLAVAGELTGGCAA